ncbi:MAG TPA: hypothetical protein VGL53_06395 [Bryobacteraceae bacterium]|jgi:hypothetical protein
MQPAVELIRDSHELMDPPFEWIELGLASALVLLVAVALWLGIRWYRRRRRARLESPARIASERLWKIEPGAMPARELFRELHATLVEYLTARGGFAAVKLTSPEIANAFDAAGFGESAELAAFLKDSDHVRFSASIDSVAGRESIRQCRAIIERVEERRRHAV